MTETKWTPESSEEFAQREKAAMDREIKELSEGTRPGLRTDLQEHIMQYFAYDHLNEELRKISKPFAELAYTVLENLPRNPERTVALRKLLEAKDAAVRAGLSK